VLNSLTLVHDWKSIINKNKLTAMKKDLLTVIYLMPDDFT